MKELMTDSEAWAVIGETIRCFNHLPGGMICTALVHACRLDLLEPYQWRRMEQRMYQKLYRKKKYAYLWPPHSVKKAVAVCRIMSNENPAHQSA